MLRPKNCKKCGGKMKQAGGQVMPKQQDYPDYESWQAAMDAWLANQTVQEPAPSLDLSMFMPKQLTERDIIPGVNAPYPVQETTNTPQYNDRIQEGIAKRIIEAPKDWEGTPMDYYAFMQQPQKKNNKVPQNTLQNIGIAMRGIRTGLGEIAGRVERGRQNQYDYLQQTALGQMNPMPVTDYQPNPYSLYAKYGGSLKKYQQGGRTPIYTSNPNDPRLRAYNDSLNAIKYEDERFKNFNIDPKLVNPTSTIGSIPAKEWNGLKPIGYNYAYYKSNPENIGVKAVFKKPVQPVVYQKPNGKFVPAPKSKSDYNKILTEHPDWKVVDNGFLKPIGTPQPQEPKFEKPIPIPRTPINFESSNIVPNIPAPNMQRAEWDMSKPSNWTITSPTGLYNQQETINLPDEASWRAAMENYRGISSQQMDGKGTATGYKKMKYGGLQHVNYFGPPFSNGAKMSFTNGQKVDERAVRRVLNSMLRGFAKMGGEMKKGGIHIKPENKGKFTDYCGGKVTNECIQKGLNSPSATIRKRANFARNARKWN